MNKKTVMVHDLDYIHELSMKIKKSLDPLFIERGMDEIFNVYEIFNYGLKYDRAYVRVRKVLNNKGFDKVSEIIYPPSHLTQVGRVNEKGEPFLYLSDRINVALSEVDAEEGDIFQLGAFELKEDSSLCVAMIGEISKAYLGGGFISQDKTKVLAKMISRFEEDDKKIAMGYIYPDLFFEEIITDPEARTSNYIHSRILSKKIFEGREWLDGVFYKSVKNAEGYNLALPAHKADDLLKCTATFLLRIKRKYSYGLFETEIIKTYQGILHDGTIIW